MARRPPQRALKDARGPRSTDRLPKVSDARRTWSGPPYQRTPGRWSGAIDFDAAKHHVGTYDTPYAWGIARDRLLIELRTRRDNGRTTTSADPNATELAGVTIAAFVGPAGEGWPWDFTRNGRRSVPGTFAHHEQCIRPLVAAFGDRLLKGGITRREALTWSNTATENQLTSVIALFNDAFFVDESVVNPFRKMSRKRTRGRMDLPDVLTVAEVERLKSLARRGNPGEYGVVLEAMIEVMATSAPRPGELWAAERARLNQAEHTLYLKHAVKKGGQLGPPKYNQEREIVIAPAAWEMLQELPVLNDRFLFASKRGKLMTQSLWTTYWHPLRDAFTALLDDDHWLVRRIADCAAAKGAETDPTKRARMPDGKLDFYELRHRACTYMATPKPHGLGLSAPDIAHQVGHRDGGALVERIYIHRNAELARLRIAEAMGYGRRPSAPARADPEHEGPAGEAGHQRAKRQ